MLPADGDVAAGMFCDCAPIESFSNLTCPLVLAWRSPVTPGLCGGEGMGRESRGQFVRLVFMASVAAMIVLVGGLVFGTPGTADGAAGEDSGWGPALADSGGTANTSDSANLSTVVAFLQAGSYLSWPHDPHIRPTGDVHRTRGGEVIDGTTHHRVRVYYSPSVAAWLKAGRVGELPDRSMIVKEMYRTIAPDYPVEDEVIGWAAMVKKAAAAHDGWYWVIYFKPAFRSMETMGTFSYSFCLTCHASTGGENTFADLDNLIGANAATATGQSYVDVVDPLFFLDIREDPAMAEPSPKAAVDPDFAALYADPAIFPYTDVPDEYAAGTVKAMPSTDFDHAWNPAGLGKNVPSYVTSDNCVGCHDATLLVDTNVPAMLLRRPVTDASGQQVGNELLNASVYSEWRASPMGMAGRDPVFFAQLESELNLHPEHAGTIQDTCLSCHGVMGQRQFHLEKGTGEGFPLAHVFATEGEAARFGALARDGISCTVCHQMAPGTFPDVSGRPLPDSGKFLQGPWNVIHGPTAPDDIAGPIRTLPMEAALGVTPAFDPHIAKSEMCGTCHTIRLPVYEGAERFRGDEPVDEDTGAALLSEAHEQDTYLEWLYSAYQDGNPAFASDPATAQSCQSCHRKSDLLGNGVPIASRLANVEGTSWPDPPAANLAAADAITPPVREALKRHTFFGMNLFVLTMYRQFADTVFGIELDSNPPAGAKNPFDFAIENGIHQITTETADIAILGTEVSGGTLAARVRVVNKAGHRLPSGVGFRRAFIEFAVLDAAGKTLWASGATDGRGVILGGDGKPLAAEFTGDWRALQPHWREIDSQDEVQVYEERTINSYRADDGSPDDPNELRLTTSFLGIGKVVKDNRLLPFGYRTDVLTARFDAAPEGSADREFYGSLLPTSSLPLAPSSLDPLDDPAYTDGSGSDEVVYKVPLASIMGAVEVRARLVYQSLPPYYLRDRFAEGRGPNTERLYQLIGKLETAGTAIADWKIVVAEAGARLPSAN